MIKRKRVRKAKKTHSFRSNFESLVYEKLCAQQLAPEYEALETGVGDGQMNKCVA